MKILITTDWYEPVINGVVTSVVNLSNELKKRGHEVKILTLSRNHHTYIVGDVIYQGGHRQTHRMETRCHTFPMRVLNLLHGEEDSR